MYEIKLCVFKKKSIILKNFSNVDLRRSFPHCSFSFTAKVDAMCLKRWRLLFI